MTAEQPAIFERLQDGDRRRKVLEDMSIGVCSISLTWEMGSKIDLWVTKFDPVNEILVVEGDLPTMKEPRHKFRFEDEFQRGYFECATRGEGRSMTLSMKGESLFVEQLRKDFRLVVPEGYPATFEITLRSQGILPLQTKVIDLNITGASLLVRQGESFSPREKIEGQLKLGTRPMLALGGEVRFSRQDPTGGTQVGIEFNHNHFGSEASLFDLLGFYRYDLFQWKKKQAENK